MENFTSRRRFLSGSLPLIAATAGLAGVNVAIAKSGMTDQELIEHHFAELSAALRRVHPEITEVKRMAQNGVLKFGLLAFS